MREKVYLFPSHFTEYRNKLLLAIPKEERFRLNQFFQGMYKKEWMALIFHQGLINYLEFVPISYYNLALSHDIAFIEAKELNRFCFFYSNVMNLAIPPDDISLGKIAAFLLWFELKHPKLVRIRS